MTLPENACVHHFAGAKRPGGGGALWSKTAMNRDVSTVPLARLFARSFARTAHLFACSTQLASRARTARARCAIHLLTRSPTHSRARGNVNDWISQYPAVLTYSALVEDRMSWVEQWTQAIGELIGGDSTSPMMKQLLAHIVLRYVW